MMAGKLKSMYLSFVAIFLEVEKDDLEARILRVSE